MIKIKYKSYFLFDKFKNYKFNQLILNKKKKKKKICKKWMFKLNGTKLCLKMLKLICKKILKHSKYNYMLFQMFQLINKK